MKRGGIVLLVVCAVLVVGSAAGGLARAASRTALERFGAPAPAATLTPSFFAYLPLVFGSWSPGPAWVTVVDEGFDSESPPGDPWRFYGQGQQGGYYWGLSGCQYNSSPHSAWAIGGGSSGSGLPCGSGYPPDVDSWMVYGPFSLQDATEAYWHFSLWLDTGLRFDDIANFCWYAWSSNTVTWEDCLYADTGTWFTPPTIDLSDPAINVLGESQVWIGFRFTSLAVKLPAEGAYVDDVVIRKCVGGTCPPASGSAPVSTDSPAERSPAPLSAIRSSKP